MADINVNNLVKVGQLQTVLTRVNTELGLTVRSHAVSGNTVSFYGSKAVLAPRFSPSIFPKNLHFNSSILKLLRPSLLARATILLTLKFLP